MQHRLGAFLAVLVLAMGVAAARADTTLRLGQVPSTMKSIGVVPYVIADQKGFFTREHLAVQLVPLDGGTDQMVKRLDAGDVEIIDQGFTRLGVSTDAVKHFEFTVLIVRPDWAKQNRAALVGFLRGFAASLKYFRDPAHRDDVAKTIVATTGVTDKIARETLSLYFQPDRGVIPRAGELDLKGLAQVIAFMGEAGALKAPLPKPERFVDRSYLRAAGIR
jgi:ABC-type nitrate/sulfonate/bicarbonate transport system substrate-binding protein